MAEAEPLVSPVLALRETFGDRKIPDISRKITACVACRKQKIKCHMRDSQPPCSRCQKRGLSCTVNRSLQMLLESDTAWKYTMEAKMRRLEAIVGRVASDALPAGLLGQPERHTEEGSSPERHVEVIDPQDRTSNDRHQVRPSNIVMDLGSGPGAIPGFYVSDTAPAQTSSHKDFISRGIISLDNAQRYFDKYQHRLDHFPYGILCDHDPVTLESVRKESPLLTAAVCTVGALHTASEDFDPCYREFVLLCSTHTFSKRNTLDDVRALCIGAFWLSDLSWSLVSMAVRIATELQLHKSIFKALRGDRQHYLRTRLWYLVYACDHHFSVAYGRPPSTRECEAVRNVRSFLECKHATEDDARLVSQVLRWSICSNIFDTFGVDVERPLASAEIPHLRRFGASLDSIRAEWVEKFAPNSHIGNYPRKGVTLQYHFAKLFLYSHAFRGSSPAQFQPLSREVSSGLDEARNGAVLAAQSILQAVVSDKEIQSFLDGLPIYFNVMIAFAAVFLIKVSTRFSETVPVDARQISDLLATLISTLRRITSAMHPRHLLVSITRGIIGLLQHPGLSNDGAWPLSMGQQGVTSESEAPDVQNDLEADPSFDPCFMGEYDFLLSQDMTFDMDLALQDAQETQGSTSITDQWL